MRILITNHYLDKFAGSELYVHDIVQALQQRGHSLIVYSPVLGEVAERIRRRGIPVVDDLRQITGPLDLIHAQHHLPAQAALSHFPDVPAVYVCHGWLPWIEFPLHHPRILRYVAISEALVDRLTSESGIPRESITYIPNFVDLARFQPRSLLNETPQRALLFCNHASDYNFGAVVRRACDEAGIPLDIVGQSNGNEVQEPENLLPHYDLIFARGRAAMESLATGAAVIVIGPEGAGEMLTTENWEQHFRHNFGLRAHTRPITETWLAEQIRRYNASDARQLSATFRDAASMDKVVDQLEAVYAQVIEAWRTHDRTSQADDRAVADYLTWLARSAPNQLSHDLAEAEVRIAALNGEREMLRARIDQLQAVWQANHEQHEANTLRLAQLEAEKQGLEAEKQALLAQVNALSSEVNAPALKRIYHALVPLNLRLKLRDLRTGRPS